MRNNRDIFDPWGAFDPDRFYGKKKIGICSDMPFSDSCCSSSFLSPRLDSRSAMSWMDHPMNDLSGDLNRLMNNFFQGAMSRLADGSTDIAFIPPLDIISGETEYTISLELPGLLYEDVSVELAERRLIVSGEKKKDKSCCASADKIGRKTECSYGKFKRVLSLPEDAQLEGLDAVFENGVLKITIPKTEPQKVEVQKIEVRKNPI